MISLVLGCFFSYLIGSIPTAYIIGKSVKQIDIRQCGSGNVGATNVFRVVGKKWGIIVMLLDMLKGVMAVLLIGYFFQSELFSNMKLLAFFYGACAIIGHNWTLFLQFKGGKGVATTAGVIAALFPLAFVCSLLIFISVVKLSGYVSLGSMISALFFPVFMSLFYRTSEGFSVFLGVSLLLVVFICTRHIKNFKRLLNGTENKISFGR